MFEIFKDKTEPEIKFEDINVTDKNNTLKYNLYKSLSKYFADNGINNNLSYGDKETFKFLIDHHFKKKGHGTILTGTVISGKAKIGQNITILPEKLIGKIRSVQKWKKESNSIEAGDRCGISVSDINPEQIYHVLLLFYLHYHKAPHVHL